MLIYFLFCRLALEVGSQGEAAGMYCAQRNPGLFSAVVNHGVDLILIGLYGDPNFHRKIIHPKLFAVKNYSAKKYSANNIFGEFFRRMKGEPIIYFPFF